MRVVSINTYGGSLLIAARRRGDEVVASMEDANYGIPIQQANFPNLNYYPMLNDWPTSMNLKDTVVIAHPPCAAFSSQNRGRASMRGIDAPKVKCTAAVFHYAMGNQAPVIAVECVPKGLEGRRALDDEYASHYGYDVYRILLNSSLLGVPQFRPRFWAIFFRKGLLHNGELNLTLPVNRKTVGQVMANSVGKELTEIPWVKKVTATQLERLHLVMDGHEVERYLATARGSVVRTLPQHLEFEGGSADKLRVAYAMGHNFTSHSMVMLHENDLAPTLLAGSWWWYKNRALAAEEYKEIMDFPREYKFPGDYYLARCREYLSRGVAPSTAQWILGSIEENLTRSYPAYDYPAIERSIHAGEVAEFKARRREKVDESTAKS